MDNAARADRRRLREQLRQERMKNEAYRRHAASRLDLHDRALGMDTRQSSALPAGHGLQQPLLEGHVAEGGTLAQAPGMLRDERVRPPEAGNHEAGNHEARRVAPPPIVNAPAEWHYERRGQSQGPVTARAVRALVSQGRLEGTSLVWREGMADWRPVSEVPQFRASFEG